MSKKGYRFGVAWIAENDNPGDNEGVDQVAGYVSVLLLADLFGKEPERVAQDIVRYRRESQTTL